MEDVRSVEFTVQAVFDLEVYCGELTFFLFEQYIIIIIIIIIVIIIIIISFFLMLTFLTLQAN